MLKNITIKTRLILVIGFLVLELIAGFATGILNLEKANGAMKSMYDDRLVALSQLADVERSILKGQILMSAIIQGDAKIAPILEQIEESNLLANKSWKAYAATKMSDEEKRVSIQFTIAYARYLDQAMTPTIAMLRKGDIERAATSIQGPIRNLATPLGQELVTLMQVQTSVAAQQFKQSQELAEVVQAVCLTGLAIGLAFAVVLGWLLIRAIVRPLEEAVKIAGAVALGDLTQRIEVRSNDETGRLMAALRDMNDSLVEIVSQVRAGTDTIATASAEIADGNLDLSSRTEQQAASLEETASSMEELTSTVRQNADNARQANVLAASASQIASKGGAVVTEVVETMGDINASANKIVEIIAVIDGISFQTNILALNAAVEAARAGEQGRGFAVVAGEVRNLAHRSASAAKEIKSLIDDSVGKIRYGSQLVDQAGVTMKEIVDGVGRVTGIMAEISIASQEQNAGIEQINVAIVQMDQTTQQNAALVEEASAAAQSLQDEATTLARTVSAFQINGTPSVLSSKPSPASARSITTPVRKPPAREQQTRPLLHARFTERSPKKETAAVLDSDWEQF